MEQSLRETLLASTGWLAARLDDPDVSIVDMRGYVRTAEAAPGRQTAVYEGAAGEYAEGHIRNAIYLDWTRDIVDPHDHVEAQVAPPERFAAELGQRGIGDESLIVAYDAHPASQFATRLWWALRYYGHERVMVLDGGLAAWRREGRPLTRDVPRFPPAILTPRVQPMWRATGEAVLATLGDPSRVLVDARDGGQYGGTVRRGTGRAGHIPGAISLPREELFDPASGRFRSDAELRAIFARAGIAPGAFEGVGRDPDRVVSDAPGGVLPPEQVGVDCLDVVNAIARVQAALVRLALPAGRLEGTLDLVDAPHDLEALAPAAGGGVTTKAGGRLGDFEVDRGRKLDPERVPLVHQHGDRGVLLQVLHGVAQLVIVEGQLIVAGQVHKEMAVTVAVKVLHGDLLDPRSREAILVAELLVDDGAGANVSELGPEKGVTSRVLTLLELEHDPQPVLPLDRHAVSEITRVDHVRLGILAFGHATLARAA